MKFRGIGICAGAAALLLAGCTVSGPQQPPRPPADQPGLNAEIQALKAENTSLERSNRETMKKLGALSREMKSEREERKRFREMMATNFDLLEQTVALSLAKTIGSAPVVDPKDLTLPQPAAMPPPAKAETRAAPAIREARVGGAWRTSGGALAKLSPASRDDAQKITPVSIAAAEQPANGGGAQLYKEDSDLNPPANPRRLTSSRAAKPLYDRGFTHFAKREYSQAILVYTEFLERFPNDRYSDNAQFWIGEALFRQSQWDTAEVAYRKVLRNFEHRSTLEGYKTPEAIYRIGQTYLKRDDPRRARQFFASVAERFPTTSAGRKAQRELAAMMLNTAGAASQGGGAPDS